MRQSIENVYCKNCFAVNQCRIRCSGLLSIKKFIKQDKIRLLNKLKLDIEKSGILSCEIDDIIDKEIEKLKLEGK